MTASEDRPAHEVYELVVEATQERRGWLRRVLRGEREAGMQIFFVRDRRSGDSFLRHIEPADDAHVFEHVEGDLATMTVAEFEARWR